MQKLPSIFLIILLAVALAIPILANNISSTVVGINVTNSGINGINDSASENNNNSQLGNNYIDNNSNNANNKVIADSNLLVNTKLTSGQFNAFKDVQNKLEALIEKIGELKASYKYTGNAGILKSLDQFEKQANKLNADINAFIQNPTAENINGKLSSFQNREAALEHEVSVKENILLAQATKKVNSASKNANKK